MSKTVKETMGLLRKNNIEYRLGKLSGASDVAILTSVDNAFYCTL